MKAEGPNSFKGHFCQKAGDSNKVGAFQHCHHCALGVRDQEGCGRHPCGHEHSGSCPQCDQIINLVDMMTELLKAVKSGNHASARENDVFLARLKQLASKHLYYIGHEMRLE